MVERPLRKPGRKEARNEETKRREKLSNRNNSLNLKLYPGKIQKEPVFQPSPPQLRANNRKMHILESFDRLEIDDHLTLHQNVEAVRAHFNSIVFNPKLSFAARR
jgi:hypothetical protein